MKGLKNRNILVTGGSSGIGQAIAVRFAKEGANVAINYRKNIEGAKQTEEMIDKTCSIIRDCSVKDLVIQGDISKDSDVTRIFNKVIDEFGNLDILINNAGIQIKGASHKVNSKDFDKVISINLRGTYLCTREALNHFLSKGKEGVIINISSVHELIPKPKYLSYSITKGGLQNMTRTLALEYADKGVRINSVAPGATITPINIAWTNDPKIKAEVESHIPLKRAAKPEEIASVVVFLASKEASYIIGQTIFVDGGLTLYPNFKTPWSSGE